MFYYSVPMSEESFRKEISFVFMITAVRRRLVGHQAAWDETSCGMFQEGSAHVQNKDS